MSAGVGINEALSDNFSKRAQTTSHTSGAEKAEGSQFIKDINNQRYHN